MSQPSAKQVLSRARRIVVKVGSSTLTREGELRPRKFTDLARQVAGLVEQQRQVVVVTSGAIAAGRHRLGWKQNARSSSISGASPDSVCRSRRCC
jgi:glutamate 5-kinase